MGAICLVREACQQRKGGVETFRGLETFLRLATLQQSLQTCTSGLQGVLTQRHPPQKAHKNPTHKGLDLVFTQRPLCVLCLCGGAKAPAQKYPPHEGLLHAKPTQRLHKDDTVLQAKAFVCPLSVWRSKSPHTEASSTQRPLFKTGPCAKRALDQDHVSKDHVSKDHLCNSYKGLFSKRALAQKGPLTKIICAKIMWPRSPVQYLPFNVLAISVSTPRRHLCEEFWQCGMWLSDKGEWTSPAYLNIDGPPFVPEALGAKRSSSDSLAPLAGSELVYLYLTVYICI